MNDVLSLAAEAKRAAGASALDTWLAALAMAAKVDNNPSRTFPDVIDELADLHGEAPALLSTRESFSFRSLAERSNRYSRWALAQNLGPGQTVALLMPNRPDYLAAWIGIIRTGASVALLNTHLCGAALAHGLKTAGASHGIVAASLLAPWRSALAHCSDSAVAWWTHDGAGEGAPSIDEDLADRPGHPQTGGERRPVTTADRALLIYTSGTTGLPKAAHVSHHRVMMWSHWFAGMMRTTSADRMYDALPLYHSVGGVVATGALLVNGGSVVIAEKFSARGFWDEVIRWDCTLFQYIGELCRYLLGAPPAPGEARHRLRLACGNGLAGDVWEPFKARFAIPQILEFYAATEGNFSLYNVEGRPGAIGRVPSFMASRFSVAIVRHDAAREMPVRDDAGFCVRCARDEVGEAIGRIPDDEAGRAGRFEGYTGRDDTDRKVLRNVFAIGDAWFRTGDLMRLDRQGYFTFVDRIGDTFRWKGENVATTEVVAAIRSCPGVVDAAVYGVPVPGADGRAGMAALVVEPGFDPAALRAHVAKRLPSYARPLFLRVCASFDVTETFKQKKGVLAAQGFDPALIDDPLFFDDAVAGRYRALDPDLFARILAGTVRV